MENGAKLTSNVIENKCFSNLVTKTKFTDAKRKKKFLTRLLSLFGFGPLLAWLDSLSLLKETIEQIQNKQIWINKNQNFNKIFFQHINNN